MKKIGIAALVVAMLSVPLYAVAESKVEHSEHEIKGIVQSMPVNKVGMWTINGKQVKVTAKTKIDEEECALKKGGMAEAEGKWQGKVLIASELECEDEKDEDK